MSDGPIRLFVGCSAGNEDLEAQAVLEYTARKHCTLPLDIVWMHQAASGPWSGWKCSTGRTPFTHFRWAIPAVCDYKGRAIYSDVDFLYVGDLAQVWAQKIPGVGLVRNPKGKLTTSFIVFDCGHAKPHVPSLDALRGMTDAHGTVLAYFRAHPELLAATDGNWDCPDLSGTTLDDPSLRAIHFTRIETQLHLKHAVPRLKAEGRSHWYTGPIGAHPRPELQALFDQLLDEAIGAGYPPERYRIKSAGAVERRNFTYKRSQVAK